MTILIILCAIGLQAAAIWTGGVAFEESGIWNPRKARRNRYAFACLVLSAAALLTAAQA